MEKKPSVSINEAPKQTSGEDIEMVTIPVTEYESLKNAAARIEELEDQIDILEVRAISEAVKRGEIETFPHEVVSQLIDGVSPVKVYRKHRKMTSQELADKIGVSQAFINQLETGKKTGSLETLKKIADALDLKVDDFFWDQE